MSKKKNKLISVLGARNYITVNYDEFDECEYIQEALIRKYKEKLDEVIIFATNDAQEKNWNEYTYQDRDENEIYKRIDSALRIGRVKDPDFANSLLDLEHASLHSFLTEGGSNDYSKVPGWIHGPYYLTDIVQVKCPFRQGAREESFFLFPQEPDLRLEFYRKDEDTGKFISADREFQHEDLYESDKKRLWLPVEYYEQLEDIGGEKGMTVNQAAARFGEVSVPEYMLELGQGWLKFNPNIGLWQKQDLANLFEQRKGR